MRLLPIAEFAYNNPKHISMGYTPIELNCGYYPPVSYEKDVNPYPGSTSANELTKELRNLMAIYKKNLQHAQKLQKKAHNNGTKPRNYALGKNVWLNSKYIKTKYNRKLETRFFGSFRVLHPVYSQV